MANERYVTEEDVKVKFLIPFLKKHGYDGQCIDYEVAIEVQEGRKRKQIFADAVVYSSVSRSAPILLCETKHPNEPLSKSVRDQAISYARLLERIAPLVLVTNGAQTQVFHSLSKARIQELPNRSELDRDILKFVLSNEQLELLRKEAKHELFIIDDVSLFKGILRSCHKEIRNNEGMDRTAAFDEMSKVMFCKLYEEKENPKGNRFRLSVYDDSLKRLNVNVVQRILDEAKLKPGYAEIFSPDAAILLKDRTIRSLVSLLENYDLSLTSFDVKGEAFEYFLGETFTGGLGEYFTPRNVVEFMVEAVDPKIGEKVIDPFCGTGGFLIYAFESVSAKIRINEFSKVEKDKWRFRLSSESLFGTDWKERTSQACKMNMMVHGDGSSGVFMHDGFSDVPGHIEQGAFDLCITNPPFGSYETNAETLSRFELGMGRHSLDRVILAIERCIRLTKPGGQIAIVVIDGILNNRSARNVRDYIKRHTWIHGVVSLNKETFQGYGAQAKTSVLFLERKETPDEGQQRSVFMAVAQNTGYAPNGELISGNELPDIYMDYSAFRGGKTELTQHNRSGICTTDDRLDAEFYLSRRTSSIFDIEKTRNEISHKIDETRYLIREGLDNFEKVYADLVTTRMKVGEFLDEVSIRIRLEDETNYRLVGVRLWGKGAFIREEKLGKDIKARYLYQIKQSWLIYNRLFASRGSFAVVDNNLDGCYVSNEFPTFDIKDGIESPKALKRFVMHVMNSPQYREMLDAYSTGSTQESRKRFSEKDFLKTEIEVPNNGNEIELLVGALDNLDRLRIQQQSLLEMSHNALDGALGLLPMPNSMFMTGTS